MIQRADERLGTHPEHALRKRTGFSAVVERPIFCAWKPLLQRREKVWAVVAQAGVNGQTEHRNALFPVCEPYLLQVNRAAELTSHALGHENRTRCRGLRKDCGFRLAGCEHVRGFHRRLHVAQLHIAIRIEAFHLCDRAENEIRHVVLEEREDRLALEIREALDRLVTRHD